MTKLKKINSDWYPQEHPGIIVGDIVDFPGNYTQLVKEGSAQLVDEDGNALPLPGTIFTCPIPGCYQNFEGLDAVKRYTAHILDAHRPPEAQPVQAAFAEEAKTVDVRAELEAKKKEFADKQEATVGKKKGQIEETTNATA